MNVVCRLMCREEIESAMRGEEVKKGNKGEQIYEHIVGSQLSFSPIKYCDMVSLGDLTVILANMKNFFITHSVKEARARNSKVYMVVFEDDGEIEYSPHMGMDYRTKYSEPSKQLLTSSYSLKNLKPLRMYEIDASPEMEREFSERFNFMLERAPVDGYDVKFGFPVQVDSYEEAVNDMLHVLFTEEQIRQIYDGFEKLEHIEYLNEEDEISREYNDGEGVSQECFNHFYEEFYGRSRAIDEWSNWDEFEDKVFEFQQSIAIKAEQVMRSTVDKDVVLTGDSQGVRQEISGLAKKVDKGKDNLINGDEKTVK